MGFDSDYNASRNIEDTAKFFKVSEVSADKGYSSRDNYEAVADMGGYNGI